MSEKTNGNAQPNGCGMILIAATVIVALIGIVMIGVWLASQAGIH